RTNTRLAQEWCGRYNREIFSRRSLRMSRWNLGWLLGVPAVVIVGLTLVFAAPRQKRPRDQDYELVELVVEVLSEVDQKYIHELTPEQKRKLVSDMINGGLLRLDEYSMFYDAEDY